jgi:fused signal recognition particle receptor
MLYVAIAIIALVVVFFLFSRKKEAPPPPSRTETPSLKKPAEPAPRQASGRPAEPVVSATTESAASAATSPEASKAESAPAPAAAPSIASSGAGRPMLTKRGDVESMRRGLARSRESEGFFGRLKGLFAGRSEIDEGIAAQIEEVLVASDVGVKTTATILERVKETLGKGTHVDSAKVWEALRVEARRILDVGGKARALELRAKPTVVLFVGVNGAGKTTTIGKLATKLKEDGVKCVLAAGDTFRAAAVQQLTVWGNRIGCEVVRGKDGADPGSVVFEAIQRAQATGAEVVLADTAGRLHTKTNLMSEMQKIARTANKALDGAPHETLLVIDATNGQNALAQATEFKAALELTGIVLTKLDGTAKGGIVLGIADELALPVRFVGLGERPDDLHEFSPDDFIEALLGKETEASAA